MRALTILPLFVFLLLNSCGGDDGDATDPCDPNPCVNGTCDAAGDAYQCTCDAGWEGDDCDTDIDDCTPNPCVHGTCTDGLDAYSCDCDAGWEGDDCDVGCGDGVILGNEVCDGTALDGDTCGDHGFDGGTLRCAADCLSVDTSDCTDIVVPTTWTCDPDDYAASTACDCECGAYDPDCDDAEASVVNCLPGQTCSASGQCAGDVDCTQVAMDTYEDNESCAAAATLPDAVEDATPITVGALTLHHTDGSPDIDWFEIQAVEGQHICMPGNSQCYFVFDAAFTPPDVAAHASYGLCVTAGTCGGAETCATASDWNASAGRYELSLSWQGACNFDDSQSLYVKIARTGGQPSCAPYALEYQLTYTDEQCP